MRRFDKNESLKVKGIAIVLLLFHHLFFSSSRIEAGNIQTVMISRESLMVLGSLARICVYLFLFISAYGLTVQYIRFLEEKTGCYGKYLIKRWISLMKPYWFVFVLSCFVSFIAFPPINARFNGYFLYFLLCGMGWSDFFATPLPVGSWWYMSFAQILLLMLPVILGLVKKTGVSAVVIVFFLLQFIDTSGLYSKFGGEYVNYIFTVILGVWLANSRGLEKYDERIKSCGGIRFLEAILLICASVGFSWLNYKYGPVDEWKLTKIALALSACSTVIFSYRVIRWRFVENILIYLGKHSGNIFLLHSFGYTFFLKFIYFSHNVLITWLFLLGLSLGGSILIEGIKMLIKKSKWMAKLV